MVTLTDQATTMLRVVLDRPEDPDARGVRLHRRGTEIAVELSSAPEPDDQVIGERGACLFVGPHAAEFLEDKALDATLTTEGKVRFFLAPTDEH
jgi:Fe-S cluster assembly iron-binding protein IscA